MLCKEGCGKLFGSKLALDYASYMRSRVRPEDSRETTASKRSVPVEIQDVKKERPVARTFHYTGVCA